MRERRYIDFYIRNEYNTIITLINDRSAMWLQDAPKRAVIRHVWYTKQW